MRIMDINKFDVVNGPGIRYSIFFAGCKRHCKGCFNPESWDFNAGKEIRVDEIIQDLETNMYLPQYEGVSILGGEPFDQPEELASLTIRLKAAGYNVWIWTGYTIEELCYKNIFENNTYIYWILKSCDVLVDGAFDINKRDITLPFKGSSNQRLIDIKESFLQGGMVLYE